MSRPRPGRPVARSRGASTAWLCLVLGGATVVAGCGGGNSSSPKASPSTTSGPAGTTAAPGTTAAGGTGQLPDACKLLTTGGAKAAIETQVAPINSTKPSINGINSPTSSQCYVSTQDGAIGLTLTQASSESFGLIENQSRTSSGFQELNGIGDQAYASQSTDGVFTGPDVVFLRGSVQGTLEGGKNGTDFAAHLSQLEAIVPAVVAQL